MYTTLIRPNKQTRLFNWLVSSFTTNIFYKFIHILKTFYQQMQYIHLAAKPTLTNAINYITPTTLSCI